jgi:hypothetical protein
VTHTHPRPMSEPCPHIPTNLTNRPITNPPLCDVQKFWEMADVIAATWTRGATRSMSAGALRGTKTIDNAKRPQ